LLCLGERVGVERLHRPPDQAHHLDAGARGLDRVLAERELVELPHAGPPGTVQGVEELERLDEVDRADDHVVVPAAEVVVDVDGVELVPGEDHLGRVGGGLAARSAPT
jgi:hypothetical protein